MERWRGDLPDELVSVDALVVLYGGNDVPVAERNVAVEDGECLGAMAVDAAGADCVDRGAVGAAISIPKWNARELHEVRGSLK